MKLNRPAFLVLSFGLGACFSGQSTLTASAGADQAVLSGATVTLDASGSRDSGGAKLTYTWSQNSGPSVTLSSATAEKPTFTAPTVSASTKLAFQVVASNGKGSAGATTTVTVNPGSAGGPMAVLNAPSSVNSGANVTLDASSSTGMGTLTYSWAQTAPTCPGSALCVSLNPGSLDGVQETFVAPTVVAQTPITFLLVVIDGSGHTNQATATINVFPMGTNLPPTAMASASPSTVNSGGQVTLNGSGTVNTAGATITGYAWSQVGTPAVTLSSTTAQNPTFTAPTVAATTQLTFNLNVTDSNNQTSASPASAMVTVNPAGTSCSATSCPNGCCDMTVNPSMCVTPETNAHCGSSAGGGSACVACSGSTPTCTGGVCVASSGGNIKYVFVVMMENTTSTAIYGDTTDAPYVNNTLMAQYGYATNYNSNLHPSEPNYIFIEAGTNTFNDTSFTADDSSSTGHSTSSTQHLATQMSGAGITWTSYQEDMPSGCPVSASGLYAAKHDPFVFFQDVAGSPPSSSNSNCSAHHKDYASHFATDLAANAVGKYNFITPNLCHTGHGASGCGATGNCGSCSTGGTAGCICQSDAWMSTELPRIVNFVNANQGLLLVVWDEGGSGSNTSAVLVVGPNVIQGANSTSFSSHAALTKSIDEIFGLTVLSAASSATDFRSFFTSGKFP